MRRFPDCILGCPEIMKLKEALVNCLHGMDRWAADEDGVHPDAAEHYDAAAVLVGVSILKEDERA